MQTPLATEPSGAATPADPIIVAADEQYRQGNWRAALMLYETMLARDPAADAAGLAVPFARAHCQVELAPMAALDRLSLSLNPPTYTPRERAVAGTVGTRATALCRAGDMARAARLLRLLAGYDGATADAYANCIIKGRTPCADLPDAPSDRPPAFLVDYPISDLRLAQLKRDHAGARLLLLARRYVQPTPTHRYELTDNMLLSAQRFGLTVAEMNSHVPEPGSAVEDFPARLDARIREFRPSVIAFDDLYDTGLSSDGAVAASVGAVLERARRETGLRVVKTSPDAWWVWAQGREQIFRGLGESVDLIHHCHPTILGQGTSAQNARVYCYLLPTCLPAPMVANGTIPRAVFIGGIHAGSTPRIAFWAEAVRLGLPIDFHFGAPLGGEGPPQFTDADYARMLREYQLVVSLTRRSNGVTILVCRTIETALCGGVLLEEDSADTPHFFKRGIHYIPFVSLADLQELLPKLLADPVRRHHMTESAQHWAQKYFSGDHFWAGIFDRLYG